MARGTDLTQYKSLAVSRAVECIRTDGDRPRRYFEEVFPARSSSFNLTSVPSPPSPSAGSSAEDDETRDAIRAIAARRQCGMHAKFEGRPGQHPYGKRPTYELLRTIFFLPFLSFVPSFISLAVPLLQQRESPGSYYILETRSARITS